MGIITGTFGLIIGLLLILLPKPMSKFFVSARTGMSVRKKEGKLKAGLTNSLANSMGEKRAVILMRLIGVLLLILSIFAYMSPNAP
ncbi:MAG: hypothetical protein WC781_00075 [Candidatus Pacearchaeota archaeon]|jgi:4-hydroxybenzoate polyprenyltransferase